MLNSDFCYVSSRIGIQKNGYFASDNSVPARIKDIANKYLKVHRSPIELDPVTGNAKVPDSTFYVEDLDFAPIIRDLWNKSNVCDNIYMKYEGADLFKILFICPHLAYDKHGGSDIDESYRVKNILHIHDIGQQDPDSVIYAYSKLDKSEPSSYVGPRHGYDVACTYTHFFENNLYYFIHLFDVFTKEFPEHEITSEYDLIQSVITTSAAFTYPCYPMNSIPMSYADAEKFLAKSIKREKHLAKKNKNQNRASSIYKE